MASAESPRPASSAPPDAAEPEGEVAAETRLTWAEQETLDALRRLARAQAQVQGLEGPGEGVESEGSTLADPPRVSPEDANRLEQLHADSEHARAKASSRLGRSGARARAADLERAERVALERLGFADFDAYRAHRAEPGETAIVDHDQAEADREAVAFARQELAAARQAWLELQALALPTDDADPEAKPLPRSTFPSFPSWPDRRRTPLDGSGSGAA